jgi:hypothetical protein
MRLVLKKSDRRSDGHVYERWEKTVTYSCNYECSSVMSRKTKNDSHGAANRHAGDFRLFSSVFSRNGERDGEGGASPTLMAGTT